MKEAPLSPGVGTTDDTTQRGMTMKKFGFAGILASGLAAALLSVAAPAQADLAHNIWANDRNGPHSTSATAPEVNTSVHH